MPFADIQGQRIYYEDSGGPGLVVILAHGFLTDRRVFDAQVAALSPEFRVVGWDQRGFGRTAWDGAPYTFWDSARDCLGLLDELGVKQAVVGGMSQGGMVSLRVALSQPSRVKALVLLATPAAMDPEGAAAVYHQRVADFTDEARREELLRQFAGQMFGPEERWEPWLGRFRELPPKNFAAAIETLKGREDLAGRLGQIGCPALVIHGANDERVPLAQAEQLCKGLRGAAPLVTIEGAGHAPGVTHPDQVNGPLLAFLRGLPVR